MVTLALELAAFARRVPGMLSPAGWAAVGVLILFLAFGAWCSQRAAQGVRDRQAAETLKIERKAATGRETASDERAIDTANLNLQRKATDDALATLPDSVPSDRRVLRHCLRLPDNGAGVPECQRLAGQAPTGR